MLKKIKAMVTSPVCFLLLLGVKIFVYYWLIDVNMFLHPLLLGTAIGLLLLLLIISECSWKHKDVLFSVLYIFFSVIMFADTMYYNYYNQTVSVRQIYQVSNVAKVPQSFVATLIPASICVLWDIPLAIYWFRRRSKALEEGTAKPLFSKHPSLFRAGGLVLLGLLAVNPLGFRIVTKINSVGFFSHHVKDIVDVACETVYTDLWEPEEVLHVVEGATSNTPSPTELSRTTKELEGVAKGKNLIVIQLEAFQNFVINRTYNGQELTPNLNQLIGEDSLYFENYYSVIGKGNTADAEFATLNSLYPLIDGESYRLYTENTYNGLPWQLKEEGYETYAFHGNEAQFWNRKSAYPYQGIDHFYSIETLDDSDIVGLGISDESVFRQMVQVLKKEEQPFFSFGISLTSHHPYELPQELQQLDILPEDEGSKFANYLQTVHYTDQAVGLLIQELKDAGLYEDTVIAFYGDHHGLNCTMDDNETYVGRYLGKEYGYEEMLKVPCIIHIPGSSVTETVSTLGCQVDFLPTMAYLFDMELEQPYIMGENLLTAKHGFAAFTAYLFEGSFAYDNVMFQVSREGTFEDSRAWRRDTLKEVGIDKYKKQYKKAVKLKQASKQVLEQDLIADYVTHVVPKQQQNTKRIVDVEKQQESENH